MSTRKEGERDNESAIILPKHTYTAEVEALQPTKRGERACTQNRISICFEVSLLIFAALSFVQILFVPKQLNEQFEDNIKETVVMSASRQKAYDNKYQHWERNTFDDSGVQLFNFYVYNITNPYEVLNGSIPKLQEIGPYIYRRFEFKNDVVFSEDSCTVSYRYDFSFEYQAEMTSSQNTVDINETVTILNPGMLTFFNTMNTGFALVTWAEYFNSAPGIKLFYQVPIRKVILGVTDPELAEISFKAVEETLYGLLNQASINMVERTGYCDRYDLRVLEEIWNTTNISYWASTEMVYPSRETRNWPWQHVSKEDTLTAWHIPFSRKVNYTFDQTVRSNGLDLWRFKLSDDTLKNATNYPYNAQYFSYGHDGVLNFTVRKEIPEQTVAYLSFPHFYQGEYYVKHVGQATGTNAPDADTDATFFEMEPETGIVLKNWLGFQTNFQLFPLMDNITYINSSGYPAIMVTNFTNLPTFIVPMGYQVINGYAPSDVTESLANSLNLMQQLKDTSFYGGISFGVVLIALSVWLICRRYQKLVIEQSSSVPVQDEETEVSMTRSKLGYD